MNKKNVLYTYFESLGNYFIAEAVKCGVCGKVFKVKKGFVLLDNFLICYKHLKEEFLKRVEDVRKK